MVALNKVIIAGNLARDIELRHTPQGTAVADVSIAINSQWKDKDGKKHEEVTFVDCTLWARTAEIASEHLRKGSPVLFEGSLKTESWEDKDTGKKRTKLKVNVESMQFLGEKSGGGGNNQRDNNQRNYDRNNDRGNNSGYRNGGGGRDNSSNPRQRYDR